MIKKDVGYILKLIGLILLFVFVLDKLIYLGIHYIESRVLTGAMIGKANHYFQVKDSVDYLVFGSSRANHHLNNNELENSFNIGLDGKNIAYSATLLKSLPIDRKQTIFFHLDPHKVVDEKYIGEDLKSLNNLYHENTGIREEIDLWGLSNPLQNFFWLITKNGKFFPVLKNALKPSYDYKSYNGYDPLEVKQEQIELFKKVLARRKVRAKPCKENLELNPIYNYYLEELIDFCRTNNKELIFFTTPTYNDPCNGDNLFVEGFIVSKSIQYLDFSNFFVGNTDLSLWKDYSHLSSKGAEIFTREFLREWKLEENVSNSRNHE